MNLQSVDAPRQLIERVRNLSEGLHITDSIPKVPRRGSEGDTAEASWLARDGYAVLKDAVVDVRQRRAIGAAMRRCVEDNLPATFVYLLDEVWMIGEELRLRISAMLRQPYVLEEDGWAWWIPPGQRGWVAGAHRDNPTLCNREAPERLSVWVALDDVPANRACIYLVPLDRDPSYPSDLRKGVAPLEWVRAAPIDAGTALVWNENLLHWGTANDERSGAPRVVISFTARRADAEPHFRGRAIALDALDPFTRLDIVAGCIAEYSEGKSPPDVTADVLRWAQANCALRAVR
jgi:hypothetical protein